MPDFDTRTPQEPDQPSRQTNMTLRLGIGGSILLLAVVAVVITVRAVEPTADQPAGPPAEQLSQKIQTPPTPAYHFLWQDPTLEGSSEEYECAFTYQGFPGYYTDYACPAVVTKVADPVKLASITQQIQGGPLPRQPNTVRTSGAGGLHDVAVKVEFNRRTQDWYRSGPPQATSYCFEGKDLAVYALHGHLHEAEFLGKTDDCFVIVYEGYGPGLRCADRTTAC